MKANNLRRLIGKRIQWEEHYDPRSGTSLKRTGILLEVKGRNILVDQMGSNDWKWVPDMRHLKQQDGNEAA